MILTENMDGDLSHIVLSVISSGCQLMAVLQMLSQALLHL